MWGISKKSYIGIDFGTASIKVVELGLEKGAPVLLNYGEINLALLEAIRMRDQGSYDAQITIFLRALLERIQPRSRDVYVAMPAFIGLIALVEFPSMSESDLEKAIQFEAHKYIPSPLEEVALSWEVVGERRGDTGAADTGSVNPKLEVLLVAALNKEVERYESYIQSVGYTMQFLELETFSMVRSAVHEEGVYIVVDIGSRATNFVLVENRLVKFSRNIDVGGRDITRTLMDGLNISFDRAEILKKSEKDFLTQAASRITFLPLELIVHEMQRMLETRQEKNPHSEPLRGIILSGGTAGMTGLAQYISDTFRVPAEVARPWKNIQFDKRLQPAVERMGTAYSVALGLALRGVERDRHHRISFSWKEWWERTRKKMKQKI